MVSGSSMPSEENREWKGSPVGVMLAGFLL